MTQTTSSITLVFTVCTAEQYPFAKVLKDSLPKDIVFRVGITQGKVLGEETISLEEILVPNNSKITEKYDNDALIAASLPFFADYFLQQQAIEKIIYFDPTVQLFGDLNTITQMLATAEVLLTPRITRQFGQSIYGDEKLFLNTGMYDAGFWAVRKTKNSLWFMKWWQERLTDHAYFDFCNGMNHAQLWLNYVPIFFQNVMIVKHIGWNVALQNLQERILTKQKTTWTVNLTEPLLFVNFREMLSKTNATQTLLNTSGGGVLVAEYLMTLKKYTSEIPAIFSLHRAITPEIPYWKKMLRQKVQKIIDNINHFPLYHYLTK